MLLHTIAIYRWRIQFKKTKPQSTEKNKYTHVWEQNTAAFTNNGIVTDTPRGGRSPLSPSYIHKKRAAFTVDPASAYI